MEDLYVYLKKYANDFKSYSLDQEVSITRKKIKNEEDLFDFAKNMGYNLYLSDNHAIFYEGNSKFQDYLIEMDLDSILVPSNVYFDEYIQILLSKQEDNFHKAVFKKKQKPSAKVLYLESDKSNFALALQDIYENLNDEGKLLLKDLLNYVHLYGIENINFLMSRFLSKLDKNNYSYLYIFFPGKNYKVLFKRFLDKDDNFDFRFGVHYKDGSYSYLKFPVKYLNEETR